jgi:TPR repeat protein
MTKQRYRLPEEDTGGTWLAGRAPFAVSVILAIALVGGAVGYFFLTRRSAPPVPVSKIDPSPPASSQRQEPQGAQAERAGDQARAIIAQIREQGADVDLPELYERAEQFKDQGLLADSHLLHFYAAREAYAPSALALGTSYDPNYHSAEVSLMDEPDPAQAHKWYTKAVEGGDPAARERLAELRVWVEESARAGDPQARRLLMQWDQ